MKRVVTNCNPKSGFPAALTCAFGSGVRGVRDAVRREEAWEARGAVSGVSSRRSLHQAQSSEHRYSLSVAPRAPMREMPGLEQLCSEPCPGQTALQHESRPPTNTRRSPAVPPPVSSRCARLFMPCFMGRAPTSHGRPSTAPPLLSVAAKVPARRSTRLLS